MKKRRKPNRDKIGAQLQEILNLICVVKNKSGSPMTKLDRFHLSQARDMLRKFAAGDKIL